ncbi:MAG: LysM peptidoglycan-binding domain-containing protein [Lachnospiraceae bacterium]|nr:LysM peptidoglycan-binding domain-containing protein [Lachnospiraceae bacterium]
MLISVVNQRTERTKRYGYYYQQGMGEKQETRARSFHSSASGISSSVTCSRPERIRRIHLQRQRAALKKRIQMFLLAAAVMFMLGAVLTGFSHIHTIKVPVYKYYTAVTVRCDDTLWDIAQQHITESYSSINSYIQEIKEINNMKSDAIYYGQKLVLPYYSTEIK